jgi:hypothetical protein
MPPTLAVAEMKILEQARAQSRAEVRALEQLKEEARDVFLSNGVGTAEDFERRWPQLLNKIYLQQARRTAVKN